MATTSKVKTAKTEKHDVGVQTLLLKIVKGKDLLKRPKDATLERHASRHSCSACVRRKLRRCALARNVNMEEDLCDQLFNHSELRLACMPLKMSRKSRHVRQQNVEIVGVTHKKLAKVIGTTPSKTVFFMHKFRKQGLIDYKGDGDVKVFA